MSQTVTMPPSSQTEYEVLLRPRKGWQPIDLIDLWNYRELLIILALRDIKVRYKQTVLGAAWAIIQPFVQMIVFTMLAGMGNIDTQGIPAPVFYFCGSIIWMLFATALTNSSNSLVGSQNLITKIYFPRLVIPISAVITSLLDFAIALAMFFVIVLVYRQPLHWQMLSLPIFVALAFFAALAVGLWLSAMNVEFRDVRYIIPFMVQIWLFITPVIYPAASVIKPWKRIMLACNPMTGVVEGFRWCMLGTPWPGRLLVVSMASITVLLIGGLFYFRRMEKTFADLV